MRSLIHSLPTSIASLPTPQSAVVVTVWAIAFCLMSAIAILLSDATRKRSQHDRSTHQTLQRNSCVQESAELL
ncbi:hypothetical protein [Coleofasciculus sp. H7-2]|uniref:hypothetical protein n=1 Tax=Coleofasciculus sp. H7-2 TaxID=3351545 RepID=UPI00366B0442